MWFGRAVRRVARAGSPGVTVVEFALVMPVVFVLLVLFVEACWQLTVNASLTYGARVASRFGVTGMTAPAGMTPPPASREDALRRLVVEATGLLQASRLSFTVQSFDSFAASGDPRLAKTGAGAGGKVQQITLSYVSPYLTGLPVLFTGSPTLTHQTALTVLNEPFPTN